MVFRLALILTDYLRRRLKVAIKVDDVEEMLQNIITVIIFSFLFILLINLLVKLAL